MPEPVLSLDEAREELRQRVEDYARSAASDIASRNATWEAVLDAAMSVEAAVRAEDEQRLRTLRDKWGALKAFGFVGGGIDHSNDCIGTVKHTEYACDCGFNDALDAFETAVAALADPDSVPSLSLDEARRRIDGLIDDWCEPKAEQESIEYLKDEMLDVFSEQLAAVRAEDEQRLRTLVEAAHAVYDRCVSGEFYSDHDGDMALLTTLRAALASSTASASPAPEEAR